MWLTQFGEEETVRLMECNNQRPTFSLRFDTILSYVPFDYEYEEYALCSDMTSWHIVFVDIHLIVTLSLWCFNRANSAQGVSREDLTAELEKLEVSCSECLFLYSVEQCG